VKTKSARFIKIKQVPGRRPCRSPYGGSGAPMMKLTQFAKSKPALLFLAPSLIGLLFFYIYPFITGLRYMFMSSGFHAEFLGLHNIMSLFRSELFQTAMFNNAIFTLAVVPATLILSLVFAAFVWESMGAGRFFRSASVMPYVAPTVAVVLLWTLFFDINGPVNQILSWFGAERMDWVGTSRLRWLVITMYLWKNTGFNIILILASMNVVEKEVLESATLEGANAFRRMVWVVIPQILPTIFFVTTLSMVNSFRIFKEAYLIGGMYPDESLYTVQHFMYNQFASLNYNYVVSASVIFTLFVILLVGGLYIVEARSRR